MDVTFTGAGGGDANQLGLALQLGNRRAAAVAHPGAKPSHQLMNHRRDAALVGDAALDPFWHQLVGGNCNGSGTFLYHRRNRRWLSIHKRRNHVIKQTNN